MLPSLAFTIQLGMPSFLDFGHIGHLHQFIPSATVKLQLSGPYELPMLPFVSIIPGGMIQFLFTCNPLDLDLFLKPS